MASTSLLLSNPKSEKSSIVCQLRDGRAVKIKIASGISVKTKHWSIKSGVLSADHEASTKNKSLKHLKERILDIYLSGKQEGLIVDAIYIRDILKPTIKARTGSDEFWEVWDYYLQDKKDHFTEGTKKKFKTLKTHFQEYEKSIETPWKFQTITESKLENLQSYFIDLGFQNDTTAKYIEGLKMFLNWSIKNKYSNNLEYKNFSPIRGKQTLRVALSKDEMQAIRNADLKGKGYLENARKLFILSTLTGLRYSDYSRVKAEHLKNDEGGKILQIRMQKTGDIVDLPLNSEGEAIIQELIAGTVHPISNQKMNDFVKELCQMAEINDPFEIQQFKGKLVISSVKPKYELVSTHTGRRTFATNLLLEGVLAETVMKFTGHRDMVSFSKYINIPKKKQMDLVRNALDNISQIA
jgi:site-specific recombinase XerD